MARPLRKEYPGAVYHVMACGNQGRSLFKDDKDRKRFLQTLEESCQKTGWEIAETERKLNAKSRCHNSRTDPLLYANSDCAIKRDAVIACFTSEPDVGHVVARDAVRDCGQECVKKFYDLHCPMFGYKLKVMPGA